MCPQNGTGVLKGFKLFAEWCSKLSTWYLVHVNRAVEAGRSRGRRQIQKCCPKTPRLSLTAAAAAAAAVRAAAQRADGVVRPARERPLTPPLLSIPLNSAGAPGQHRRAHGYIDGLAEGTHWHSSSKRQRGIRCVVIPAGVHVECMLTWYIISARCCALYPLFRAGAGFAMILWEMATMTKPFERMGREEFFREVVSSACFFLFFVFLEVHLFITGYHTW